MNKSKNIPSNKEKSLTKLTCGVVIYFFTVTAGCRAANKCKYLIYILQKIFYTL